MNALLEFATERAAFDFAFRYKNTTHPSMRKYGNVGGNIPLILHRFML